MTKSNTSSFSICTPSQLQVFSQRQRHWILLMSTVVLHLTLSPSINAQQYSYSPYRRQVGSKYRDIKIFFLSLYLIVRSKKYFYQNQILVSGTKTIEIDSRLLESVPSTKTNSEFIQVNNPPDNKTNNNNNDDDDNYNDDYEKNTLITACDIIKRCRKSSGCLWYTQLLIYAAP